MTASLRRLYPHWRRRLHAVAAWVRHRQLRPEDVVVASYPRSGNTWMRFLLYELLSGERPAFQSINRMIPNIGSLGSARRILRSGGRLLKTHEQFRPEYRRAVYIVRDARDVALSEFDFLTGFRGYHRDFETFLAEFAVGEVNPYGSWDEHVTRWLDAMETERAAVQVVHYESLRADPVATLKEVLKFLGEVPEDSRLHMAVQDNSIERMQEDENLARAGLSPGALKHGRAGHRFVRDGIVAGWRTRLAAGQIHRLELACGEALRRAGYN
jgi:hypothetical protein